jgi:hypothetical protein
MDVRAGRLWYVHSQRILRVPPRRVEPFADDEGREERVSPDPGRLPRGGPSPVRSVSAPEPRRAASSARRGACGGKEAVPAEPRIELRPAIYVSSRPNATLYQPTVTP